MYAKKSLGVECVRYFHASFVLVDLQIYKKTIAGLRPARIENPQLKRWGSGDPQQQNQHAPNNTRQIHYNNQ